VEPLRDAIPGQPRLMSFGFAAWRLSRLFAIRVDLKVHQPQMGHRSNDRLRVYRSHRQEFFPFRDLGRRTTPAQTPVTTIGSANVERSFN